MVGGFQTKLADALQQVSRGNRSGTYIRGALLDCIEYSEAGPISGVLDWMVLSTSARDGELFDVTVKSENQCEEELTSHCTGVRTPINLMYR